MPVVWHDDPDPIRPIHLAIQWHRNVNNRPPGLGIQATQDIKRCFSTRCILEALNATQILSFLLGKFLNFHQQKCNTFASNNKIQPKKVRQCIVNSSYLFIFSPFSAFSLSIKVSPQGWSWKVATTKQPLPPLPSKNTLTTKKNQRWSAIFPNFLFDFFFPICFAFHDIFQPPFFGPGTS